MGFFIKKEARNPALFGNLRPILLFFSLLSVAALLFAACVPPPAPIPPQASADDDDDDDDDDNTQLIDDDEESSKKKSSLFSRRARKGGRCPSLKEDEEPCSEDEECLEFCDELFKGKRAKAKCGKLKPQTVAGFVDVFDLAEDGDVDEIETDDLDCLLSVNDSEFIKKVKKKTGPGPAKKWLYAAVSDEELAEILNDEDSEHELLGFWTGEAEDDDPLDAFAAALSSGDFALEIAARQTNTEAWEWMMNYIQIQCKDEDYCDPDGVYSGNDAKARELVFFCKTFEKADAGSGAVKAVLKMEAFQSRYKTFIESLNECVDGDSVTSGGSAQCIGTPKPCKASSSDHFFKETKGPVSSHNTNCNVGPTGNKRHANRSVCYHLGRIAK